MLCDYTVFIHLTFKFSLFKPITSVLSNHGDIHLAYKLTALHKLSFMRYFHTGFKHWYDHKHPQHHLHKNKQKVINEHKTTILSNASIQRVEREYL